MAKDSPTDKALSPVALDLLKRLGHGIRTARSRRGIRQEDLATRTSMSRVRLRKLEKGDPTVGLGALVQVLEILGLLEQFSAIADPENSLKTAAAEKIIQEMARTIRLHWQEEHANAGPPEDKLPALRRSYKTVGTL